MFVIVFDNWGVLSHSKHNKLLQNSTVAVKRGDRKEFDNYDSVTFNNFEDEKNRQKQVLHLVLLYV